MSLAHDDITALAGRPGLALPWLERLRWGYVLCQILVIFFVTQTFDTLIPVRLVVLIIGFEIMSNALLHLQRRRNFRISSTTIGMLFLLDAVLLTLLLYATGGAMNPFTFLYLVHVVFGAIILPPGWAWGLSLWTAACYFLLFLPAPDAVIPLPGAEYILTGPVCTMIGDASGPLRLHLQGMWVAFAVTVVCIVYFVGRIQAALAARHQIEQALREEKARADKLGSLVTLAAGAAHELSTPLATIAVAAGELVHTAPDAAREDIRQDAVLIRQQAEQCREILYDMAASAGEHRGEELRRFTITEATDRIMGSFSAAQRKRIIVERQSGLGVLVMEFRTLCRVVASLVQNALEASEPPLPVVLRWEDRDGIHLCVSVRDQGGGMDAATRARAAEPFFTTKDSGLGLGLFLARSLALRHGGNLELDDGDNGGTRVVLSLRLDRIT